MALADCHIAEADDGRRVAEDGRGAERAERRESGARGRPLVFDIARGSLVDGPGIRTTVFFKGCPLRCVWCHNPESHEFGVEIAHYAQRCIRCGVCRETCPSDAIDLEARQIIRRDQCNRCGICVDGCDSLALRRLGVPYSANELMEIILADKVYFETSGGGVTFSGGEPLIHLDYLAPLVRKLKGEGIHIAVQTCGYFEYSKFRTKVLPWVDEIFYDIKHADPREHVRLTGRSNKRIIENLKRLVSEEQVTVLPRIPLVPGLTATRENLRAIADLFRSLGIKSCQLLAYNPPGRGKWKRLGKKAPEVAPEKPIPWQEERGMRREFAALLNPSGGHSGESPQRSHLARP